MPNAIKQVICDTNIWYNLGSSIIQRPKDTQLIATWSNVIELAYSHPKNKQDFDLIKWKQASKAILDHSARLIELDPFEFATKTLFPDYTKFTKRDLTTILKIISEKGNPLTDNIYKEHQKYFDAFFSIKEEFVAKMLKYKDGVWGEFIKNPETKELFKKTQPSYDKLRAAEVLLDIEEYLNQKKEGIIFDNESDMLDSMDKVTQNFQFYISVKQRFFHNLTIMKSMTVQPNDFIDLTSLIYIGKDYHYWTLENRWLNLIREAGQSNKLHNEPNKPHQCQSRTC